MMSFKLQPILQNELIKIIPLKAEDFETLYSIASDPLLWEQHPNKDRYKKEVFEVFFKGAIESKGAFLVYDVKSNVPIGSSRFYDFDGKKSLVSIGYTFIAKSHWGKNYNPSLKALMLQHAFQFVNNVVFHIGAKNIRSQKAIEKLGAIKTAEEEMSYYGEQNNLNFIYLMEKSNWKINH